ncbi:hypothetical protein ACA910_003289 [Epithemia clementina (nom. ined.)]
MTDTDPKIDTTSTPKDSSAATTATVTIPSSNPSQYAHLVQPEWLTPKQVGDAIPNVTLLTRVRNDSTESENPFDWKPLHTTKDLFPPDKRVVVVSLPGAFTPTCSTSHLPGYEQAYEEMTQQYGIDEVYCMAVNDPFVMRQWGLHVGLTEDKTPGAVGYFTKVKLIPDGGAHFTRAMGLSNVWDCFGERSWRYSMVVNQGVIEQLFMEPDRQHNATTDPFHVSDAQTMLDYLKTASATVHKKQKLEEVEAEEKAE